MCCRQSHVVTATSWMAEMSVRSSNFSGLSHKSTRTYSRMTWGRGRLSPVGWAEGSKKGGASLLPLPATSRLDERYQVSGWPVAFVVVCVNVQSKEMRTIQDFSPRRQSWRSSQSKRLQHLQRQLHFSLKTESLVKRAKFRKKDAEFENLDTRGESVTRDCHDCLLSPFKQKNFVTRTCTIRER